MCGACAQPVTIETMNGLISVREAANLVGVHPVTIRRRIDAGDIPAFRIGDHPTAPLRIARDDLVEYVARGAVEQREVTR